MNKYELWNLGCYSCGQRQMVIFPHVEEGEGNSPVDALKRKYGSTREVRPGDRDTEYLVETSPKSDVQALYRVVVVPQGHVFKKPIWMGDDFHGIEETATED